MVCIVHECVRSHVCFCLRCMFMHAFVYLVNLSFGGLPQVVSDGKVCEPLSWQHAHLQECGQTVRGELTEHNGCLCYKPQWLEISFSKIEQNPHATVCIHKRFIDCLSSA